MGKLFASIAVNDCDTDDSYIVLDILQDHMQDDRFQAYFASLDIETNDAWTLFKLLDNDETGHIDIEEFVEGCLQLKGTAKAIHVAKLSHDNKMLTLALEDFMGNVENRLDALVGEFARIE